MGDAEEVSDDPQNVDLRPARSPKSTEMSEDMRQAIAFERAKDRAAARQARIEARHPSHFEANRAMDEQNTGRKVKDTRAPGAKRDQ